MPATCDTWTGILSCGGGEVLPLLLNSSSSSFFSLFFLLFGRVQHRIILLKIIAYIPVYAGARNRDSVSSCSNTLQTFEGQSHGLEEAAVAAFRETRRERERERESFIRNNLHNGVVSGAAR